MDLKKLEERSANIRLRRRQLYKLARSLNFSAIEASVLANTSEANIRKLVRERDSA